MSDPEWLFGSETAAQRINTALNKPSDAKIEKKLHRSITPLRQREAPEEAERTRRGQIVLEQAN